MATLARTTDTPAPGAPEPPKKGRRRPETVVLAGWIEARYSARRQLWQARLRSRPPGGKTTTEASCWVEATGSEEALALAGDELLEARLALTRRVTLPTLSQPQRGTVELGVFVKEVWWKLVYPNLPQNSKDGHEQLYRKWIKPFISGYTLNVLRSGRARDRAGLDR